MKKFIVLLIVAIIACSCSGYIVGDSYEVTKVSHKGGWGYEYQVEIKCLDPYYDNYFTMYTNELYSVGDTISIK